MAVVRTAKVSSKGQITIPLDVRNALRLREGDTVKFVVNDGTATVQLDSPRSSVAAWAGALREGEGKTIEQISQEIREERGW